MSDQYRNYSHTIGSGELDIRLAQLTSELGQAYDYGSVNRFVQAHADLKEFVKTNKNLLLTSPSEFSRMFCRENVTFIRSLK